MTSDMDNSQTCAPAQCSGIWQSSDGQSSEVCTKTVKYQVIVQAMNGDIVETFLFCKEHYQWLRSGEG